MNSTRPKCFAPPRRWYVLWSLGAVLAACGGGGGGVGGEAPTAPLTVTAVEPADAASGVARDARPVLTFSAPVAPATVGASSIVLETAAGIQAAAASAVGNRITLAPAGRLLPLTEHVIRVTPQVAGEGGERPASDILRRFTTADGHWRDVQTVGTSENLLAQAPVLALDRQGNALAAWIERAEDAASNSYQAMRVGRYDAATATWSAPMPLSAGPGDTFAPQLVMDDAGNGLLVWQHLPPAGQPRIFAVWAARFNQASGQWAQPHPVSNGTSEAFWPTVAVRSNGDVAVAWVQRPRDEGDTVWWATSTTAPGAAWSQARRADDPAQPSSGLASQILIALSPTGGRMALAWASHPRTTAPVFAPAVVWARVVDETPAGQLAARIVSNNVGDTEISPDMVIDRAGDVHVAWLQVHPSTSGGARTLWTVRHDATGWRARALHNGLRESVEVLRLATNRAATGVDATWLAWVQGSIDDTPSRLRALRLGPDRANAPDSLASGGTDTLAHRMGLVVDPRGNALAAWLESALPGDRVRTVRYGALPGTWGAPQPFGSDMGFSGASVEDLAVNAAGDILLGWRGVAIDDRGDITHRPLRTRRFE